MRYWSHPESDDLWMSPDDVDMSDGQCDELERDQFLEVLVYRAMVNAAQNDEAVPDDDVECAAEMIEGGVFSIGLVSPEVTDDDGQPLEDVVRAVARARALRYGAES